MLLRNPGLFCIPVLGLYQWFSTQLENLWSRTRLCLTEYRYSLYSSVGTHSIRPKITWKYIRVIDPTFIPSLLQCLEKRQKGEHVVLGSAGQPLAGQTNVRQSESSHLGHGGGGRTKVSSSKSRHFRFRSVL